MYCACSLPSIKDDQMDGTCCSHRSDDQCIENLKEGDTLRDLVVDERIILKWIVNNIHVARDRAEWRDLKHTVINIAVP
jgi:hypothetical protein